jgi:hypothetical protein
MSEFLFYYRRPLSIAAAASLGLWLLDTITSRLPDSAVLLLAVFLLAAVRYAHKYGQRSTALVARASTESPLEAPDAHQSAGEDEQAAIVEQPRAEYLYTRGPLAQEQAVVAMMTGDLTPDQAADERP